MADAQTASFAALKVWLGDGNTPETFANVGTFSDKSLKLKAATGSTDVPDTSDASKPFAEELEVKTISLEVTGNGVIDLADVVTWETWWLSGLPKDIRVMRDVPGAQGGGYWSVAAVLTDFTETAKKGEKQLFSATIASTGRPTWTLNA